MWEAIWEGVKDFMLFLLFLESIVVIVLLILLLLQVRQLVQLVRGEAKPILESVRRTTSTVQGTATFVSDTTVIPLIRVASVVAAARGFVRSLLGLTRPPRQSAEPTQGVDHG